MQTYTNNGYNNIIKGVIVIMSTVKEFFLDLSNSENKVFDLSEYKGQKIKISIETIEQSHFSDKIKSLSGSIKVNLNELDQQIQEYLV